MPPLRVSVLNYDEIQENAKDGYCVLSINFVQKNVSLRTYLHEDEGKATSTFARLEQNIDANEAVLLVSIAKMKELQELTRVTF